MQIHVHPLSLPPPPLRLPYFVPPSPATISQLTQGQTHPQL